MDSMCMKRIKESSADIHFPKFSGRITVCKDTIKFDGSLIILSSTDSEAVEIFELGLVFPDLIYGASAMGNKYEFKETFTFDTLFISNISQLHFPNQRSQLNLFHFYFTKGKRQIRASIYLN